MRQFYQSIIIQFMNGVGYLYGNILKLPLKLLKIGAIVYLGGLLCLFSGYAFSANVCERSSCGSIGCTSYGFYPSVAAACGSNSPQLRFQNSSGDANYYCVPPTSPSVFASYAVCSSNQCPGGSAFNADIGECVADEKPECATVVGNPIDARNGNKYLQEVDVSGGGLELVRSYTHSVGPNPRAPGWGRWQFPYTQSVASYTRQYGDDGYLSYVLTDKNVRYVFRGNEATGYAFRNWQLPPFQSVERLYASGTPSGWEVTHKDGTVYYFNDGGYLTKVEHTDGAQFAIEYTDRADGTRDFQIIRNLRSGAELAYTFDASGQHIESADLSFNGQSFSFQYSYNSSGMLNRVINPDGTQRDYHYDAPTLPQALTSITDEGDNAYAKWSYDDQGRAVRSSHAGDTESVSLAFNPDGTTTLTNALGKRSIYHFETVAGSRKLTQIDGQASSNCAAASKAFTYTPEGRVETETDWSGKVTRYTYNDRGLVTAKTIGVGSASEQTVETTWHPDLSVPMKVTRSQEVTEYCYDASGQEVTRATREPAEPSLDCTNP
ncbi:hypothetical protein [Marinobacter sp. V034]|uniref:hypothetical protein n=1 Tax=Marinobacter sp. V034 TaxID=3459610 RepID=UPI004043C829